MHIEELKDAAGFTITVWAYDSADELPAENVPPDCWPCRGLGLAMVAGMLGRGA